MKNIFMIINILVALFLAACSFASNTDQSKAKINASDNSKQISLEQIATDKLNKLSIEEKVAQLFIIVPEYLEDNQGNVTSINVSMKNTFNKIPVGGIIFMGENIVSPNQTKSMLRSMREISYSRIELAPFLCVDEEGGIVARIANNTNFDVKRFERMSDIGLRKNYEEAFNVGITIGSYLSDLGFNVDFAPVADVLTNSQNTVVKGRAFSDEAESVRLMTAGVSAGLKKAGILTSYKHFPGHGDTTADTHEGYAYTNKTKTELMSCELIPFIDAIKNEEPFIMVGHISLPKVIGDNTPASLSKVIITDMLRNELGYKGLIITDALNMGAISKKYSSTQACMKAIDSGVDVLLMPHNFMEAYNGIIKALKDGKISEKRLNESVLRILMTKLILERKQKKG